MAARKRMTLSLAFVVLAGAALAACSKSEPAASPGASQNNTGPINFTITMQDGGNNYAQQVKQDDIYYKEMSKAFGNFIKRPADIKFEMMSAADYQQQMTVRFASGQYPEVFWTPRIDDAAHPKAVENGIFLQLNDLIDKYAPNIKKNVPAAAWSDPKLSKDGKIYALPKMAPATNFIVDLYRKDYLDKLGMKEPQTLDDYLAFFEKVKNTDLNGNGKQDEIGYAMRKGLSFSNSFFGYFGAYPGTWRLKNGEFVPDIISPEMKEAVKFYKKLYDNGYINKDFLTTTDAQWSDLFFSGRAAMWEHQTMDLTNGAEQLKFVDKNADVWPLPGPKNAQGKANLARETSGVNAGYVITNKAKNPIDIIKYFDWSWSDDEAKNRFFNFGIEGKNYTVQGSDVKWDPNAPENTDKAVKAFYQTMINTFQDVRLSPLAVKQSGKYVERANKAIEMAKTNTFKDESIYMPVPESMKTKPELGTADGSLFMDMFAKVVTGKDPVDAGFDKFVADWKARGGNDAIKEATAWYKAFYKK